MGDFLFWALVFFLGFCAVSAIGAIAQAIALKITAEGDPRDVAEEERARTIARVLAEAEAKQALAAKAAKEIDHVLHPSPYRQNWNSQRRHALADLRLRSPEAAAEAERRLEVDRGTRTRHRGTAPIGARSGKRASAIGAQRAAESPLYGEKKWQTSPAESQEKGPHQKQPSARHAHLSRQIRFRRRLRNHARQRRGRHWKMDCRARPRQPARILPHAEGSTALYPPCAQSRRCANAVTAR